MKKILGVIIVMAMIAVTGGIALSASVPKDVDVTANLLGACSVTTPTIAFGSVLGNGDIVSSTLNIDCTSGLDYSIDIGGGLNPIGLSARQMADTVSQTDLLPYALCQDAGCGTLWGTGAAFGSQLTGTGAGAVAVPIYGQFNNTTSAPAGSYSDTVVVTINY